jgi:hypothetical protein
MNESLDGFPLAWRRAVLLHPLIQTVAAYTGPAGDLC